MGNSDWGLIVGIAGLLLTAIGLFWGGKKLVMKIAPKTKHGDIDMSNSEYTMEKHIHNPKKKRNRK